MDPETAARAFEPFFTTKPLGQGTGLGLSMVYGFARQSGGFAELETRPGKGTTVRIFLPRHEDVPAAASDRLPAAPWPECRETILVVEDEPDVRDLIVDVLRDLGYQVLEAADGTAGLETFKSNPAIGLLLTDIGLPGLNGRQLADAARSLRPDLKILFMTGYAHNLASSDEFVSQGTELITKPFRVDQIAKRVQRIVGGAREALLQ